MCIKCPSPVSLFQLLPVLSGTSPRFESGLLREIRSSESRHVCHRINILGSQLSVTKQYKFGTSASWESNRRSGVALATRYRQWWYYHLQAHGLRKGDEHSPTLQWSMAHFIFFFTLSPIITLMWFNLE